MLASPAPPEPPAQSRLRAAFEPAGRDRVVLGLLVALAAALRFVDLRQRGTWDADQGHDMLVLRGLIQDGQLPLLGPPTSIGDFHHGVLYYYLLAPAAALSRADPFAVVAEIALAGIAAVVVTWWLARSIGGWLAGAVAGLLMAVSSSAIEESTFIWNPNLIALSASVAVAAAWKAWTSRRTGWWIVAGLGVIATMHCHILGVVLLPPVAGLLIADARRRATGVERRAVLRAGAIAIALLLISYIPLLIHEVASDFSELRGAAAFLAGGGAPSSLSLPVRLAIVALRVLAWPLTGLVTDAPLAALAATSLVVAILVWRATASESPERTAARWFATSLGWTVVALGIAASGLATVVPGLPNDHYHAFADPIVFVTVGLGVAALARRPAFGSAIAVALVAALIAFNLARLPQPAADGGFPAADRAAARVLSATGDRPVALLGLPTFKGTDALGFPLVRLGATVTAGDGRSPISAVAVLCDNLFADAVASTTGGGCGGSAEDAWVQRLAVRLVDRFEAAPGRWVSVYLPG